MTCWKFGITWFCIRPRLPCTKSNLEKHGLHDIRFWFFEFYTRQTRPSFGLVTQVSGGISLPPRAEIPKFHQSLSTASFFFFLNLYKTNRFYFEQDRFHARLFIYNCGKARVKLKRANRLIDQVKKFSQEQKCQFFQARKCNGNSRMATVRIGNTIQLGKAYWQSTGMFHKFCPMDL